MPSLAKLYNEFKGDGFVVLAINIKERQETVKRFVKKMGLPFPVILDSDGKVTRGYGIKGHPAHFLINGDGKMIGTAVGARDWTGREIRDLVRFLVDQNGKKR